MDTRLLLISHASTAAMRAGRFPADDPLDARGLAEAAAARARLSIPDDATVCVSPAVCARETAAALGLVATVDEGLADMDYGRWHGRRLADLAVEAPQDLVAWTHDSDAAAHGGESFSQLVKRLGQWLDALDDALSERGIGLTGDALSEDLSDSVDRALSEGATAATDSGTSTTRANETKTRASGDRTKEVKNRRFSAGTGSTHPNTQTVVAVTHAPAIRATIVHALGTSAAVFPRIEIAPLSMVELRRSRRGWTWWPASL